MFLREAAFPHFRGTGPSNAAARHTAASSLPSSNERAARLSIRTQTMSRSIRQEFIRKRVTSFPFSSELLVQLLARLVGSYETHRKPTEVVHFTTTVRADIITMIGNNAKPTNRTRRCDRSTENPHAVRRFRRECRHNSRAKAAEERRHGTRERRSDCLARMDICSAYAHPYTGRKGAADTRRKHGDQPGDAPRNPLHDQRPFFSATGVGWVRSHCDAVGRSPHQQP